MLQKFRFIFLAILLFLVCSSKPSQAQWQTDVRLTNDPAQSSTTFNNSWTLAANGNHIHIVWTDGRNNDIEIYYKRSTDGGISWEADKRLADSLTDNQNSQTPSVAVFGSFVHVVWEDSRDGDAELYYKRSIDQGESWGEDVRLTANEGGSKSPSISVNGQNIHVAWEDYRDTGPFGYPEIYYKRSTNSGTSWEPDTRLTNDPAESSYPCVTASGNFVHVSWDDNRGKGWDLYYKRSTNGGESWQTDVQLTNSPSLSVSHSIASSGSEVHIVGQDDASGVHDIHYIRSTDDGISWEADTLLTANPGNSQFPSIFVSGSAVHLVWQQISTGTNWEIYYKRSLNGGVSWEQDTNIINNISSSHYPFIAASGTDIYAVWIDNRDGNYEVYYKRNPTGNVIGISGNGTTIADKFILEQNYPNPFNPTTVINYSVPQSAFVTIKIYDLLGREVKTLVNSHHNTGNYTETFDGTEFASGIYYYTMTADDPSVDGQVYRQTRKMILMK